MALKSLGNIVFLVCLFCVFATQASAQDANNASNDLGAVAPADAIIALSIDSQNWSAEGLMADLQTLDWERANTTLQNLITIGEQTGLLDEILYELDLDSNDFSEIVAGVQGFASGEGPAFEEVAANCPAIVDVDMADFALFGQEAIFTVGFGASPIPAATAITRLSEDQASSAFEVQQTILDCARADMGEESITVLEEGDINLYVVNDGGDLPVIIGSNNGIFFLSTDPNAARTVARLSNGSDEPNLANSGLFENSDGKISSDGIRYAVNFAAIADIVSNFKGMVIAEEPSLELFFDRGMSVLRTLGTNVGSISQSEEGLVTQNLLSANPEGGDPALAALMLCTDCAVGVPELAPFDSVSVSSQYLAISEFIDYLQTWVDDLEDMVGPMDVKELLAAQFGVDLDVLLFDWLGTEVHTISMEVPSQKLSTLVYQPAQAIIFPIDSVEAAEAAADSFQSLWPMVRSMMDMIPQDEFSVATLDYIATSTEEYNGVEYTRYRMSVNTDVAVTYIGNNLVTASPAYAIEKIIDVSLGNIENITTHPDWQTLVSATEGTPMRGFVDAPAFWNASAELIGLFSQPAAFFAKTGLDAALIDGMFDSGMSDFDAVVGATSFFDEDLSAITSSPLELSALAPTTLDATLGAVNDAESGNISSIYYTISDAAVGDIVTVTVDSTDFDTYMRLIRESENGAEIILDNDDFAGSYEQSQISFMVEEGAEYIIEATSYGSDSGGNFMITAAAGEAISEDFEYFEPYSEEYAGVFETLAVGSSANAQLVVGSSPLVADYYALPALNAGDEVSVSIESLDFDTYIYVIDATNGAYVAENDDFEGSYEMSQVNFVAEEGVEYLVKATSFDGSGTGSYTLELSGSGDAMNTETTDGVVEGGDMMMPEVEVLTDEELKALVPSFSDLLHITELIPESMHIIADNLGYGEGHSEISESEIYRHSLYRVDW